MLYISVQKLPYVQRSKYWHKVSSTVLVPYNQQNLQIGNDNGFQKSFSYIWFCEIFTRLLLKQFVNYQ